MCWSTRPTRLYSFELGMYIRATCRDLFLTARCPLERCFSCWKLWNLAIRRYWKSSKILSCFVVIHIQKTLSPICINLHEQFSQSFFLQAGLRFRCVPFLLFRVLCYSMVAAQYSRKLKKTKSRGRGRIFRGWKENQFHGTKRKRVSRLRHQSVWRAGQIDRPIGYRLD